MSEDAEKLATPTLVVQHVHRPAEKVNRGRTAIFVYLVVTFTLGMSAYMGLTGVTGKVAEIVADGFITMAMFVVISKIAGTSLDYSGVLTAMFGRRFGGGKSVEEPTYGGYPGYPGYGGYPYGDPYAQPPRTAPNDEDAKG